ncbi:SDR family oxidoreductase, partial [Desulfosarcina cetonica]|uniref:SDR family oxidoreductase n=1 Tax=Desulfosarcina cetonica TaxID=90730 RepID=UPI0006D06B0F
ARSPERLRCRPWGRHPKLTIAAGDALDRKALVRAAAGCGSAFYLIHSMNAQKGHYADADRRAAANMVEAGHLGGLERIIYLGGLGAREHEALSPHLKSRHEVEDILTNGPVPVTILRAAMILGSGSASFEMLRYLADRLPVMVTPRWVRTPCQPIAIGNVLDYLIGCLTEPGTTGQTFDIGGPDVLTYQDLIQTYARVAGLRPRIIIPVPVLTPWLSAKWVHLITPVPASIAQPLAEGLAIPVTCQDRRILDLVPIRRMSAMEAIQTALARIRQEQVETCWFDGGGRLPPEWTTCGDAEYAGGTVMGGAHRIVLAGDEQTVWRAVTRIGGREGWYFAQLLWHIRGAMDRLVGGPGLRRGRRHPTDLRVGDGLDFWRVIALEPNRRLLLLAEMKAPGDALLEFVITPQTAGRVELKMVSRFLPRGLGGILYWYALLPTHQWLFEGMLRAVAARIGMKVVRGPEKTSIREPLVCRR